MARARGLVLPHKHGVKVNEFIKNNKSQSQMRIKLLRSWSHGHFPELCSEECVGLCFVSMVLQAIRGTCNFYHQPVFNTMLVGEMPLKLAW